MSLQVEIEMNNHAVAFLQNGESHAAMDMLKVALGNMKDHFQKNERSLTRDTDVDQLILNSFRDLNSHSTLDLSSASMDMSTGDDGDLSSSSFDMNSDGKHCLQPVPVPRHLIFQRPQDSYLSFYEHALLISAEEDDRDIVTSAMLFNMGLISHSRGINKSKSHHLYRALSLYKKAFQVLGDSNDAPLELLLLAIFNNTAHIYSYLYQLDELRQCMECMQGILLNLEDVEDDESMSFFLFNVMFYSGIELTLAPAA